MMNIIELALHFKEMREMQNAYFASKKANRYGDKKLLAASKAKEAELDQVVKEILAQPEHEVADRAAWLTDAPKMVYKMDGERSLKQNDKSDES